MKKIISILATIAMVATMFTSVVNAAADVTFSAAALKAENDVSKSKNVVVNVTITAPNGFAGFKNVLKYDADSFTVLAVNKSADMSGTIVHDVPTPGELSIVYGSATDHMPTKTDFNEYYEEVTVDCSYVYTVILKANDTIVNGEYNFTLENDAKNTANAAGSTLTGEVASSAKTTIVGGVNPAPPVEDKKEATITPESKANAVVDGLYTQGFKATVTPNDQIVSEVKVVLSATKAAKTAEPIVWTAPVEGFASFEFAVNVLNVPDGETVTAAWDMTAAFAE